MVVTCDQTAFKYSMIFFPYMWVCIERELFVIHNSVIVEKLNAGLAKLHGVHEQYAIRFTCLGFVQVYVSISLVLV